MSNPNLEVGQILFSPNWQRHECPEWVIAFLVHIGDRLETVMWNRNQEHYEPPFGWGGYFKHDVFEIHGFRYPDDDEYGNPDPSTAQPYNFKWGDVEISWYKHLGRGTTINQDLSPEKGIQMLNECLAAVNGLDAWLKDYLHGEEEHPAHRTNKPERVSNTKFDFRTQPT
jgi:hypothetical protein